MENITGYQYMDQPASELLKNLPNDIQTDLKEIFKKIHSAGQADGYAKGKYTRIEQLER